jgi:deoxyribodipyrimidine photolyase-related protein
LFAKDVLQSVARVAKKEITDIIFIEHPLFYGKRRGSGAVSSLALNKVRLAYMHVVGARYIQSLRQSFPNSVSVVPYREALMYKPKPTKTTTYAYIDPCDHLLDDWVKRVFPGIEVWDSPSFLLTRDQLNAAPGTGTRMTHGVFYEYVKDARKDLKALNKLLKVKNLDTENREPYRPGALVKTPEIYRRRYSTVAEWDAAATWIKANGFSKNPAPLIPWNEWVETYAVYLPVEHDHARAWMNDFLKERFANYGKYQDVVLFENPMLFHSGLSVFLNNGLLTPVEVLEAAVGVSRVPMASFEGFVRQIAGWREYTRFYYVRVPAVVYKKNVFGLKRKLGKEWYNGTTGIEPVDKTVRWAMNYGYINHIQRLMIVSNFMTLNEYSPDALYRWMFEFSLDSYEWVMVFNCYSMGSWGDGGVAMRKPYISKATYVLTMSNVEDRKGTWVERWNDAYGTFMTRHQKILRHTQAWRPNEVKKTRTRKDPGNVRG